MSLSKITGIAIFIVIVWLAMYTVDTIYKADTVYKVDMVYNVGSFVSTAEATVGRPLTPVSVAGVARRTSRRD